LSLLSLVQKIFIVVSGEVGLCAGLAAERLTVADLLQVVEPTGDSLVAGAVRNVISEGTIPIRERFVERDNIGNVIFTQIALPIAFPKIILRAHAASMILLAFLGRPDVWIEGTILFLCDRGESDLEGILRVTKWIETLVVFVLHNESPPSAFTEMESSRHAKPDHRREGIPKDYSISAAPHFR
jgi:hypothetical protein